MRHFPPAGRLYPPPGIAGWRFWVRYVAAFALTLPLAVAWRVFAVLRQAVETIRTRSSSISLLDGRLTIRFVGGGRLLQASAIFEGRFVVIRYGDVLIDPGAPRSWPEVERYLRTLPPGAISRIICTHYHEEHIGNASAAAKYLGVPIYASPRTLNEIQRPARLPFHRRFYLGQPLPCDPAVELRPLDETIETSEGPLSVIPSSGHCSGHVALYCPVRKMLFSGDAYMGEWHTSPNGDVDGAESMVTLERFCGMEIETLLEGHGELHTMAADIPSIPGVVRRDAPRAMLLRKLAFLRWARDVVRYGENRELHHGVIEACLFPPFAYWAWSTWARDESMRFFTGGEFSRTQFVRSFLQHPERMLKRHRLPSAVFRPRDPSLSGQ